MKSAEHSPSAQVLKKTQSEEFDLVIPVVAWLDRYLRGRLLANASASAVVDHEYIGGSGPNGMSCEQKHYPYYEIEAYFRRSKEFGNAHDGSSRLFVGDRDIRTQLCGQPVDEWATSAGESRSTIIVQSWSSKCFSPL